jgi:hypothetical protein
MKKQMWFVLISLLVLVMMTSSSFAALLGVNISYPRVQYISIGTTALTYNATNQLFSVNASPVTVLFSSTEGPQAVTGARSLQIRAFVDNTGALVGGTGSNDMTLSGTVTQVVGGVTNTYSGVLLTGAVTQFGSLANGSTAQYDFRFTVTGGVLASSFACGDIAVHINSGGSTFTGNFTVNFNGQASGAIGLEDVVPPQIDCPTNITVECQAFANGLPGAYISFPMPTATDNCDTNPTVTCIPPSGSFFALLPGFQTTNYTVVCVAADGAGNTNICTFDITVEDTVPPEFSDTNNPVIQSSLNEPIYLTNDQGECYATFTFPIPLATDIAVSTNFDTSVSAINQNGATISLTNLGNGMLQGQFPVTLTGSNVITITADDGHGNTTQHQVAIYVADTEPPVINCPSNQTVECTSGPVFFEEPTVSDNCPNVTISCVPTNGSVLGLGANLIVCTATDCAGNSNMCTFYVTVQDTTPPTISCPTNVTVECGQSTVPASTGTATATDNCDPLPTVTFSDVVSGNCPRTIARTWTATDHSGNSNSCVQIITIVDTTPPVISCPPDIQLQCGASTNPTNTGTATATDSCSTNVTITFTDAPAPANCTGQAGINRTWTATDACGNTSTCVQHITFADTTPPVITCPPDAIVTNLAPPVSQTGTATATDNCGTQPVVTYSDAITAGSCPGSYVITRTWLAVDACGNSNTCAQVLTYYGNTSGVFGSVLLHCSNNDTNLTGDAGLTNVTVTLTDASGSTLAAITTDPNGAYAFSNLVAGTYLVVVTPPTNYSQTYPLGSTNNQTEVTLAGCQEIPNVDFGYQDGAPVTFTQCPSDLNLGCNPTNIPASNLAQVAAADDRGAATITSTSADTVDGCVHTRTITYKAAGTCGNTATCAQIITWTTDTTPPTFTLLPQNLNLGCNPTNIPTGNLTQVAATDSCSAVTITSTYVDTVAGCVHTRTITYTATDACGNKTNCTQIITWTTDTTPPTFTLLPQNLNLGCNPTNIPTGNLTQVAATDNCSAVTITSAYIDTVAGCVHTRTITYTATDACGNAATCTQIITWTSDPTPPVIVCPANVTVIASSNTVPASNPVIAAFLHGATATDNCGGNVTITNNAPAVFSMGTTTVTFTATDACGNSASCQAQVIVVAQRPSCDTILANQQIYCQHHFDNCGHCQYALFTGNLMLTGGDQASDFRTLTNAFGTLQVTVGSNSPVVIYNNNQIRFRVDTNSCCGSDEVWDYYGTNPVEQVIYKFTDNQRYNALGDTNLPSSAATGFKNVGELSTVFIDSSETRFYYGFQQTTKPITIVVDGIVLLSVNSSNVVTSTFPFSTCGKTVQVLFPARLVPGNVISWYATANPAAVSSTNLIYSQTVSANGTSTDTYVNEGATFLLQVPGLCVNPACTDRCATATFTIGQAGVTKMGCGSVIISPLKVVGYDWIFGQCSNNCDEYQQECDNN